MARWVERQSEFSGVFQIKLSATATSLLLCADNPALDHIQVGVSAAPEPAFAVPCELREQREHGLWGPMLPMPGLVTLLTG